MKIALTFIIVLTLSLSVVSCGSGSTDSKPEFKRDYTIIQTERLEETILDIPLDFEFEAPKYWTVNETNSTTYDEYSISVNSPLENNEDIFREGVVVSISPVHEDSYEEALAEVYEGNLVKGVLYDNFRLLSNETIMMHEQVAKQYIVSYTATNISLDVSINIKSKIINFVTNGLDYSISYFAQDTSYESYLDVMDTVVSSINFFECERLRITNDRDTYVLLNERIESTLAYDDIIEDKILITYRNTEKPDGYNFETEGFWMDRTTGDFSFSSNVPGIFKVEVIVTGQLDSEIIHDTLWVTKAKLVFHVGN